MFRVNKVLSKWVLHFWLALLAVGLGLAIFTDLGLEAYLMLGVVAEIAGWIALFRKPTPENAQMRMNS